MPADLQTRAQVGLEQPALRSCPLPFHQESSYVQLLSIRLFPDVMGFVAEAGKKPLEAHVQQSLLPLLYHLHDENQRVAEVRIPDLLVSPWEVARLPAALAPCGLRCSSFFLALATEQQLRGPLSCCPSSTRCPT